MSGPSSTASHFLLLQFFLGLVLFAHIVFFHEDTTRTRHVDVVVNESQTGRGKGILVVECVRIFSRTTSFGVNLLGS